MRLDKFTQMAQEAVLEAQSLAQKMTNPAVEPEHLLQARFHRRWCRGGGSRAVLRARRQEHKRRGPPGQLVIAAASPARRDL